jgi:2',3'-cyclic-nucleotide 2'-phosphodiesterase/3'-nucleotidase
MSRLFRFVKGVLLIVTVALIVSCSGTAKPDAFNIYIVETSDVHGSFMPYNYIKQKPTKGSLAHVSAYVNKLRGEKDSKVILLDNGDVLQGQPIVYYDNINNPDNHIAAAMFNYMKYDAVTVGNHDIEGGHRVYDNFMESLNMPMLGANVVSVKNEKPYFKPYTVVKRYGYKIAVLGLTTPGIPKWLPETKWEGMRFDDMVSTAKKWVDIIKKEEKPDFIVGLFHAGHDATYGGANTYDAKNENASLLVAENVPGFDVVFIGHDHDVLAKKIDDTNGDDVWIVDPGSSARNVGVAKISFVKSQETGEYDVEINGEIVSMKNIEPDTAFINTFDYKHKEIIEYCNTKVGECSKSISSLPAYYGASEFMSFLHKVQLETSKADISFAAPLSYKTEIAKGDILVSDLFKLYRFENMLTAIELTGEEIKNYLEYSYEAWFNTMQSSKDHLMLLKSDSQGNIEYNKSINAFKLAGAFYNFDSAEGIIYTVDVRKEPGERITIKSMSNGDKFMLDKKYKVAVNSYRANGGGGHLLNGAGLSSKEVEKRTVWYSDHDIRYYMIEYIKDKGVITFENSNNWKAIPAGWVKNGWDRDFPLLFSKR